MTRSPLAAVATTAAVLVGTAAFVAVVVLRGGQAGPGADEISLVLASPSTSTPATDPSPSTAGSPSVVGSSPGAVRYPDGAGGVRDVVWPAPAGGLPWTMPDPSLPHAGDAAEPTDGARDLRAALAAATGYSTEARDQLFGTAGVLGRVDGRATAYRATVSAPSPRADRPASFHVVATRGGVTTTPTTFDYCGTWPQGRPGLAADLPPSTMFEFSGPLTCSLVDRPDGLVVVHLRVDQGERHGAGDPGPGAMELWSFTVRPDGTAVRVAAWAAVDAGWDAARVEAVFRTLDDLAATLPYPSRD